ncbi:hypothetical protein ACQ0P8_11170 [Halodesulfovibrio aestuarii]|uniref:hypothetical protein n=1 Tax=Halodesulfovibrio aestuarii TaxID=126333 RepID=UPI003D31070B
MAVYHTKMEQNLYYMMHSTHDHKIELLKTLSSLNKQYAGILRRKPPGEDRWSPIMVLEHIVLAERSLLGGLPETRRYGASAQNLCS